MYRFWILLCLFTLCVSTTAYSQPTPDLPAVGGVRGDSDEISGASGEIAEPAKEDKEVIKTGVIASFGTHAGAKAVDFDTRGVTSVGSDDEGVNPIRGSISRIGSEECKAIVTNTSSDNRYSLSFRVVGVNSAGSRVQQQSYSASLGPNESTERRVRCRRDLNMTVELASARKLGK